MSKTYDIAICDATSLTGETLIRLLEDKKFPIGHFYPLSDIANKGAFVEFRGEEIDITTESGFECIDVDLLFVPCGSSVKETVLQQAVAAGCMVIDGSKGAAAIYGSLVASPCYDESLMDHASMQKRIIIPSSPAAVLLTTLSVINEIYAIDRINITAFQPASTAGHPGVDELRKQTVDLLNGKPVESTVFPDRIAYNLIPQKGNLDALGMTDEEVMIETEICTALNISGVDIRSTSIITPVFYGDCLSVTLDVEHRVDLDTIADALNNTQKIKIFQGSEYPTVANAAGSDEIMVGRLRSVPGKDTALSFWLVADGCRQSALAMISAAEILISTFL